LKCEDCIYSDIVDWEQDKKTGKATPIWWCEKHNKLCEDLQDCELKEFKNHKRTRTDKSRD